MKKREIVYLIDTRDIMAINADSNRITPTGDEVIGLNRGLNRHIVPGKVTESDANLAIRVAEELFTERLDYFQGKNTEIDYDEDTGDPIEIFDDDLDKMPVNYCVSIYNYADGSTFKLSVEYLGIDLPANSEDMKNDCILDMFIIFRDLLILRKNKKTSQDFYYKNYKYRICSAYL